MLSRLNHQFISIVFCPKTLFKNLFFRKLFPLSILHTNSNPLVKNSESPPIRVLVHDHIKIQDLQDLFVFIKEKCCTRVSSGVEQKLYKELLSSWCRRVVHIWQRRFIKWCTRCWFWVYKIKDKKNLKRVTWGLDVGQEDRTKIKSLVFAFAFFEIYFFS